MKYTYNILLLIIFLSACSNNTGSEDDLNCTLTPTLFTEQVSNILETSAVFEGQITSPTCESAVTSQGFVYAKTTLPKTDDFIIEVNGENISSELRDLERNTTYYMRTFFVNPTGEYYGNQVEFTTSIGAINLTTKSIENITINSGKTGVIINDDGGSEIINKGICWSTSQNPTINDNKLENNSQNYEFESVINELTENTTYYVRAFATNENGTTYGNEETFKTLTSTYKVELEITGYTDSCGVKASYFYYDINYKFDDNDLLFEGAEWFGEKTYNHSKAGTIMNNLEVTIRLGNFDPDNPSEDFKGAYLDNMSIKITNTNTNEQVLNSTLESLFICTDTAYKNIINFNPKDGSYNIERLTYEF